MNRSKHFYIFSALQFYEYLRSLQPLTDGLPHSTGSTLEFPITLGIAPPSTESETDPSWEGPTLKQENRENDAKASAKGRFYQEVCEATVPLVGERLAVIRKLRAEDSCGTFSLRSPSEEGRERLTISVVEVVELIVRAVCRFLSHEVSQRLRRIEQGNKIVAGGKATRSAILGVEQELICTFPQRWRSHGVRLKLEVPDAKRYMDLSAIQKEKKKKAVTGYLLAGVG